MEIKLFYNSKTIILFVILLIVTSFALGKFGFWGDATLIMCPTQADYGFPLSFVTHCESFGNEEIHYGFNFLFLIFDILIWYAVSLFLILGYNKIKK